jgi:hypothetical protein
MTTTKKAPILRSTSKSTTSKTTTKKSATATATKKSATATKSASTMEHTFANGLKVSGTVEQLETIAKAMGLKLEGVKVSPGTRGYYPSESKGLVKISEMNEYHIRRALLKRSKDYFAEVFDKNDTNGEFLKKFTNLTEDSIVVDLYTELSKRK